MKEQIEKLEEAFKEIEGHNIKVGTIFVPVGEEGDKII